MTSDFSGPGEFWSPFDDFLARFFGGPTPGRPRQRVDITQLMTEEARELVREAATRAAEWGHTDLDAVHLLWAASRNEGPRRLLSRAGADPDALAKEIEGS